MGKLAIVLGLLSALLLAGCGEQNYGGEVTMTPEQSAKTIEDEIKKIEANPNMPPQAKAAAIGNLRSRQQNAAIAGKGMSGETSK